MRPGHLSLMTSKMLLLLSLFLLFAGIIVANCLYEIFSPELSSVQDIDIEQNGGTIYLDLGEGTYELWVDFKDDDDFAVEFNIEGTSDNIDVRSYEGETYYEDYEVTLVFTITDDEDAWIEYENLREGTSACITEVGYSSEMQIGMVIYSLFSLLFIIVFLVLLGFGGMVVSLVISMGVFITNWLLAYSKNTRLEFKDDPRGPSSKAEGPMRRMHFHPGSEGLLLIVFFFVLCLLLLITNIFFPGIMVLIVKGSMNFGSTPGNKRLVLEALRNTLISIAFFTPFFFVVYLKNMVRAVLTPVRARSKEGRISFMMPLGFRRKVDSKGKAEYDAFTNVLTVTSEKGKKRVHFVDPGLLESVRGGFEDLTIVQKGEHSFLKGVYGMLLAAN